MNIMKMSDEELAVELRKIGEANNATVIHGGQQMWSVVSRFIRQCVEDSHKELVEAINYFLLRSMDSGLGGLNGENLQMIRRKMEQALASVEE